MDYSKLSDFEINKLVADKLGVYHDGWSHLINGHSNEVPVMVNDSVFWADYCNDACSAWPIILENKIDIRFEAGFMNKWESQHVKHLDDYDIDIIGSNYDENPLRAAMITFLKMKE